jgi:hypothetical protein
MMVTCKLYGRLGNQMFQIAAAIGLAKKLGVEYRIPARSENPSVWPTYFNHFPQLTEKVRYEWTEPSHAYSEIKPTTLPVCINGYFQSQKYFEHCADYIKEAFAINNRGSEHAISLHVRRGDYLELQDKHPVITKNYIEQSLYFVSTETGIQEAVVFSDDIVWCQQNINQDYFPGFSFEYSEGSPVDDLARMSRCEHNIISNSSFSWWGAWLNRNPKKIVVAPAQWFGPGNAHLPEHDIIPKDWKKWTKI